MQCYVSVPSVVSNVLSSTYVQSQAGPSRREMRRCGVGTGWRRREVRKRGMSDRKSLNNDQVQAAVLSRIGSR
jgi:hypothetical protein